MIIEFTAPPGSGKTYLAEQLKEYLQEDLALKAYKIYSRDDLRKEKEECKLLNSFSNLIDGLLIMMDYNVMKICRAILISNRDLKDKLRSIIYIVHNIKNNRIINKIIKHEPNSIFILDEGLLHAAGVYLDNDVSKQKLESYINNIKKSKKTGYFLKNKIYVIIESDIYKNYERIDGRSQGWPQMLKYLDQEEKFNKLDIAIKVTDLYKRFIKDELLNMVVIDNKVFKASYEKEFSEIKSLVKDTLLIHRNKGVY